MDNNHETTATKPEGKTRMYLIIKLLMYFVQLFSFIMQLNFKGVSHLKQFIVIKTIYSCISVL